MSAVSVNQVFTVTFQAASDLVEAGIKAAVEVGVAVSVVVVDKAGEIVAAGRADGGSVLSFEVASRKAWTAANTGSPTNEVAKFVASDPNALVYMPSIPRFAAIAGGPPLIVGDSCVGAIGVSGGSSDQDADIATAAQLAFMR